MNLSVWSRSALLGTAMLAIAAFGCGAKKTTVTGKVTYNGKPVVWGNVSFLASDGSSYDGFINLDGTYSIPDVPPGQVKIGIYSPDPKMEDTRATGAAAGNDKVKKPNDFVDPREKMGIKQAEAPNRPRPPDGAWFKLPDSAADPYRSGLTGVVKSGEPLNIDIKTN
jgi:hypothetical protein